MRMPKSPFTTRLSGSVKETELRLRSIFQWKKKRPPVVVIALVLVLMIGCFSLVNFIPGNAKAAREMTLDLIENREIVPESYLKQLDDETRQMVEEYNAVTVYLSEFFDEYAVRIADFFGDSKKSSALEASFFKYGNTVNRPLYYYFIERVSSAALYPNANRRLVFDPLIGPFIDRGGSYGLWATMIHAGFNVGDENAVLIQDYFALIDALTVRLNT